MQVFVSYAAEDHALAGELVGVLKDQQISCVTYKQNSLGGNIPSAISRSLARSEFVLVVWSQAAAQSKWIEGEWGAAYHREITEGVDRLLLVCLDNTPL